MTISIPVHDATMWPASYHQWMDDGKEKQPHMIFFIPPCIPDNHPNRITSTNCHINTIVSPDDGHSRPKHVETDKYTKK